MGLEKAATFSTDRFAMFLRKKMLTLPDRRLQWKYQTGPLFSFFI